MKTIKRYYLYIGRGWYFRVNRGFYNFMTSKTSACGLVEMVSK